MTHSSHFLQSFRVFFPTTLSVRMKSPHLVRLVAGDVRVAFLDRQKLESTKFGRSLAEISLIS